MVTKIQMKLLHYLYYCFGVPYWYIIKYISKNYLRHMKLACLIQLMAHNHNYYVNPFPATVTILRHLTPLKM